MSSSSVAPLPLSSSVAPSLSPSFVNVVVYCAITVVVIVVRRAVTLVVDAIVHEVGR
jgi:hypothetical protein